jgi:hypothetical protein
MYESVCFAEVHQQFTTDFSAFGFLDGYVHIVHFSIDGPLRVEDGGQPFKTRIGDLGNANVWLHCRWREGPGIGFALGQTIEKGCLAAFGEAHYADFHLALPAE